MKLGRRPVQLLVAAVAAGLAPARAEDAVPKELADVGIDERPGAVLPQDLVFCNQDGRTVRLGDYLGREQPTIFVLAYYRCPMLCSLVLNGLTKGLRQATWRVGERFRVVTVSIDPADTPELAKAKRENQIAAYGHPVDGAGWDFLVGDAAGIQRLTSTLGFRYRYDQESQQFAHAAGAFVVTPDGRLSRTLYGIEFPERHLRLALVEAGGGKLGSAWDKVILFCYHYDPQARSYVLAAVQVMRIGSLISLVLMALLIVRLVRRKNAVAPTEKMA